MDIYVLIGILAGGGVAFFGFFLFFYNRFVRSGVTIREALENVQHFLEQRHEQVAELVAALKAAGVADIALDNALESGEMAIKPGQALPARSKSLKSANLEAHSVATIARGAPGLTKNSNFSMALKTFEKADYELNGSARYYNALVREHNIMVESFPSAIVALLLRFKKKEFLDL